MKHKIIASNKEFNDFKIPITSSFEWQLAELVSYGNDMSFSATLLSAPQIPVFQKKAAILSSNIYSLILKASETLVSLKNKPTNFNIKKTNNLKFLDF